MFGLELQRRSDAAGCKLITEIDGPGSVRQAAELTTLAPLARRSSGISRAVSAK